MTIEGDDPEELGRLPESEKPEAPPAGDGTSLAAWASNVAGGALLRDGLSPSVVGTIVREALQDYARFRTSVKSPRRFLVKRILKRMPPLLECRPADALQVTSLAVAIADVLDPQEYWPDHVLLAHGQALRDHAYVLSRLGRDAGALEVMARAERVFAQVPDAPTPASSEGCGVLRRRVAAFRSLRADRSE